MNSLLKSKSTLRAAILAGSIAALLIPAKGSAADQVWTGLAGDQNVNTAGNWVAAPDLFSFNKIVFGSGVVNGTMTLQPWVTSQGIDVTSACTVPITINGSFLLNGAGGPIALAAGGVDLTLNADWSAGWGDISFNVGTGRTLTVNGAISEHAGWAGNAGLVKDGAGLAVLTHAPIPTAMSGVDDGYYSGPTSINAGTLQFAGGSALGSGNYGQTVSIATGATLQYSSTFNQTISGVISGGGSLTKDTSGSTLYLSGANTNTGAATVSAGILKYANVGAVGSTSGITVNGTGSVWFDPGTAGGTVSTPISLSGDGGGNTALNIYTPGGQVTFSGPITLTGNSLIRAIGDNATMNFTNAIHGAGDLSFAAFSGGAGTKNFLVLSGASDFSGGFALVNWFGAVQATLSGGDNRLPTTALVTVHGGGGMAGALDLNGNNQTIAGLTDTLGFGSLDAGARSVVNTSGTAVTLTLNTIADQTSGVSIGGTDINGTTGNNLALVKSGAATQTLSGANTYTGTTTVNGGTLRFTDTAPNSSASLSIASGATLEFNVSTAPIPFDGAHVQLGASGGTTVTGTGTFVKSGAGVLALDGQGGGHGVTFNMTGGLIDIQGGTLRNGGWTGGIWGSNLASMNIATGAMFDIWGGQSVVVDALTGGGTIDATSYGSNQTLTVGANNGSGTFSGVFQNTTGSLGLIKTGSGTLTMSGANSYSGGTTINGGTLAVTGSLSATSGVTVNTGGTLLMNNNVNNIINSSGAATVAVNDGTLAIGNSVSGKTQVYASLALSGTGTGAVLDFGSGGSNTLQFTSAGTFTGTLKIFNWTGDQVSGLTDNGGATQDRLLFGSATGWSGTQLGSISFYSDSGTPGGFLGTGTEISYAGGYEIVPVPEPATTALIGSLALCALIGYRERNRLVRIARRSGKA